MPVRGELVPGPEPFEAEVAAVYAPADVADMTQFGTDVATQTMQDIAAKFQSMADVTFILTEKLEAAP